MIRAGVVRRDDGTTIAYDVAGTGPVVAFLHGLTSSRSSWEPVTELLAADFTCVRVDLRGHGESSTAADYSMPSLAGDVRAVLEDVGAAGAAVVGHSLGATVAAVHAAIHPAVAVVCVDATLRFGDFAAVVQRHAVALRGEDTMKAVLAIDHELGLGRYADVAAFERRVLAFPRDVVLGIWAALLATPPEHLTATAEVILPRIGAPLLALHGAPPPLGYEAWLTGLVPSAQLEVWEGAGHMLHLVEPRRFAARVGELLAGY